MPVYKCTWIFEGIQANRGGQTASSAVGWSETWYADFTGLEQAITIMRDAAANSWLTLRLGMMHQMYQCKWVRASDVLVPRQSKLANVPPGAFGRLNVVSTARLLLPVESDFRSAAQINCALYSDLMAFAAIPGGRSHHRRIMLRGLSNTMIAGNVIVESSPAYTAAKAFLDSVARGQAPPAAGIPFSRWLMRVKRESIVNTPVTGITINAGSPRTITLDAPLGIMPQGAKVTIRNAEGIIGVNRVWTSPSLQNAPPYILIKARKDLLGTHVPRTGQCYINIFDYVPASQYVPIGLRNKSIGRPSPLTRGRRRTV